MIDPTPEHSQAEALAAFALALEVLTAFERGLGSQTGSSDNHDRQTATRASPVVRQVRRIRRRLRRVERREAGHEAMQEMRHRKTGAGDVVRRRVKTRRVVVLTLTALLGVMGFLAAYSVAASTTSASSTVSLRKTALGLILVNSRGHTLYLFAKDRSGKSACGGSCARFWPPLLSQVKPTAGPGVKASLFGTTRRSTGSLQVTYHKHPVYTYALDTRAGQTKGEGSFAFGAKWYAVSGRGTAVVKAPTTTTTTAPATTCAYPPC
jgi:predicted lipoprotein with Yx(FWY)xxD motif